MQTRTCASLASLVLLTGLMGCSDPIPSTEPDEPSNGEPSDENTEPSDEIERIPTQLPAHSSADDCTETPKPLSACEWLGQFDSVIHGVIVEMRTFDSPVKNDDGSVTEDCPSGIISEGIEFEVQIDAVTRGSLSVDSSVDVRIGFGAHESWWPSPVADHGDSIQWVGPTEGRLAPGMTVGFGLFERGAHLSPGPTLMFGIDTDGETVWQDVPGDCAEPPPVDLAGITAVDLKTLASSCAADAGASRHDDMMAFLDEVPTYAEAAFCH